MNIVLTLHRPLLHGKHNLLHVRGKSEYTAEYCLNSVKQYDYDNFICTILMKNQARTCALAIRSFNVEVGRVADQISQKNIGLMRLQFWEDTVDKCFSKEVAEVPKHPVAMQLFRMIWKHKFTKRYFYNLIQSRKQLLSAVGFRSLDEMETYTEQSVSNVYYLILEGCDIRDVNADHAASHLGKAQGIVQHLRSTPHARQLNFLPLPQDILLKNKVTSEDIIRRRSGDSVNDCVYDVASRAYQHLSKARSLMDKVPLKGRAALLPAVPVNIYLDRLQKVHYDVFHPSLQKKPWNLLPSLWYTNLKNKY